MEDLESGTGIRDSTFTEGENDGKRKYTLSVDDGSIRWNQPNLIAIRVFSNEGGRIFKDDPYIGLVSISDSITFNGDGFYQPDSANTLDTILVLNNSSCENLHGTVSVNCVNSGMRESLFSTEVTVSLKSRHNDSITVSLPFSEDPVTVYLTYMDEREGIVSRDSIHLPFILNR